jgi:hypothetical protein
MLNTNLCLNFATLPINPNLYCSVPSRSTLAGLSLPEALVFTRSLAGVDQPRPVRRSTTAPAHVERVLMVAWVC